MRLIDAALAASPGGRRDWGICTECGMGRVDRDEIPALLDLHQDHRGPIAVVIGLVLLIRPTHRSVPAAACSLAGLLAAVLHAAYIVLSRGGGGEAGGGAVTGPAGGCAGGCRPLRQRRPRRPRRLSAAPSRAGSAPR